MFTLLKQAKDEAIFSHRITKFLLWKKTSYEHPKYVILPVHRRKLNEWALAIIKLDN